MYITLQRQFHQGSVYFWWQVQRHLPAKNR